MRSLVIGILGLTLLGVAASRRTPMIPQKPAPRPRPVEAPPPLAAPVISLPSPAPAPPPAVAPLVPQEHDGAVLRQMEVDLGLLEERHVELARHHTFCERTLDRNRIWSVPGLTDSQRLFIDQVWEVRDAEVAQLREQAIAIEDLYDRAIRGTLTAEQQRVYRWLLFRRPDY